MDQHCRFDTQGNLTCMKPDSCTGFADVYQDAKSTIIDLGDTVVLPKNERELWLSSRMDKYEPVKSCSQPSEISTAFRF